MPCYCMLYLVKGGTCSMSKEKKKIEEDDELFVHIIGPPTFSRKKGMFEANQRPMDRGTESLARDYGVYF